MAIDKQSDCICMMMQVNSHTFIASPQVFLTMAMFTGFIWNFAAWTDPILYAVTASPKPPEAEPLVSKAIPGQAPLRFTETLLQKINAVLPFDRTYQQIRSNNISIKTRSIA
jgi:hypothetical protein